jgi:hypothetical protein
MKVNLGDISESELDLVVSAIRLSVLEEDKGRGVFVTCINGVRTWQMNSEDTWITIPGEHHSFDGSYAIPGRLILSAYTLNSAGGTCNLSINYDSAQIKSSNGGEIQMAVCPKTPEFKLTLKTSCRSSHNHHSGKSQLTKKVSPCGVVGPTLGVPTLL